MKKTAPTVIVREGVFLSFDGAVSDRSTSVDGCASDITDDDINNEFEFQSAQELGSSKREWRSQKPYSERDGCIIRYRHMVYISTVQI